MNMTSCRLGAIAFINTLPVYAWLSEMPGMESVNLTWDTPTRLNKALSAGELDVSPVSSAHYLQQAHELALLPRLSVSSYGAVHSVLVISRRPVERVETIAVPDDSATSAALLRAYLQNIRHPSLDRPEGAGRLPVYAAADWQHALDRYEAVLMIGDRALSVNAAAQPVTEYQVDLSSWWVKQTGLPFVFAVWAARKAWLRRHSDEAEQVITALCASRDKTLSHPGAFQQVVDRARQASGLPAGVIAAYYRKALCYGWSADHARSLHRFAGLLPSSF